MSTHMREFQYFFKFLHNFVLAILASSNIRVKIVKYLGRELGQD